jgi:hypothetical protein
MRKLIYPVVLAGLAGGLAEIAWIALYSLEGSISPVEVARQVTASLFPAAASGPLAPWAGLGLHMLLAWLLAAGFVIGLWSLFRGWPGPRTIWISALATLSLVWAFNFLVLLPAMGSGFAHLMPYAVTLSSKALFAVAMAAVLDSHSRQVG